jgi:hypothetical protein
MSQRIANKAQEAAHLKEHTPAGAPHKLAVGRPKRPRLANEALVSEAANVLYSQNRKVRVPSQKHGQTGFFLTVALLAACSPLVTSVRVQYNNFQTDSTWIQNDENLEISFLLFRTCTIGRFSSVHSNFRPSSSFANVLVFQFFGK